MGSQKGECLTLNQKNARTEDEGSSLNEKS